MSNFTLADLLMLLAAAQGIFLGVLILHKYGKLLANRYLTGLLFLQAGLLVHMSLQNMLGADLNPKLVMSIICITFLIGPLHYLYAKYLTHPGDTPQPREALHLIPFLVLEFLVLVAYHPSAAPAGGTAVLGWQSAWFHNFGFFHFAILLHYASYLILTQRTLRDYGRRVLAVLSTIDKVKLTWLRDITWLAMIIVVIYGLEYALLLMGVGTGNYFAISSILLALNVYAMGYLGLFKSEVFSSSPLQEAMASTAKYSKSGFSTDDLARYQEKLVAIMEQQSPYTDSNLTLDGLAGLAGLSPHNLSEVINRGLGLNFFDFVNGYRVKKVQEDLLDEKKAHLTVLALALESGFASKSTFNSIFKKQTELTPTTWRKENARS